MNKDPAGKGPLGALVVGILIITLIAVAIAMIATYWLRPSAVAPAEDEVSAPAS